MTELIPDTITERAATITWRLAHGESLQTRDVADLVGLSMPGAYLLMQRLSRVIPIYQDEQGFWQVCAFQELEGAGICVR